MQQYKLTRVYAASELQRLSRYPTLTRILFSFLPYFRNFSASGARLCLLCIYTDCDCEIADWRRSKNANFQSDAVFSQIKHETRKKGKIVPRTSQIVKTGDTEVAKTPKMRQEHQNVHVYILKIILK